MNENAKNTESVDSIVQTDWSGDRQPSEAIVEAIVAATDREPLDIEPLQNHVDTDALDALVVSRSDDGTDDVRVAFEYEEYHVIVDSAGTVEVRSESLDS